MILADMAKCGIKSIMYAGEGEPLLHPDMAQIIKYTKTVGIDVAITTNAVALTKKLVDECLDYVSWIKVSLNGGATSYASIHKAKEKDYELVWDNIEYALSKRNKTAIGVQTVVLPENYRELEDVALRAGIAGVDYYVLKPYSQHKSSVTKEYEDLTYQNTMQELARLEGLSTDTFKIIVRRNSMKQWDSRRHSYQKCYSTPYFWAYIMATGDVYGCSAYLLDERFRYGNINDETFGKIWLGDKRKASMDYVANKLDIKECRLNCRMDKVNQYLWGLKNPGEHHNFI